MVETVSGETRLRFCSSTHILSMDVVLVTLNAASCFIPHMLTDTLSYMMGEWISYNGSRLGK